MISDTLFEAVLGLNHYLNDPFWDRTYCGDLRERIIRLRDEAKYAQIVLDTHPSDTPPSDAVLHELFAAERREARERPEREATFNDR
jgi:hypothetical protein